MQMCRTVVDTSSLGMQSEKSNIRRRMPLENWQERMKFFLKLNAPMVCTEPSFQAAPFLHAIFVASASSSHQTRHKFQHQTSSQAQARISNKPITISGTVGAVLTRRSPLL